MSANISPVLAQALELHAVGLAPIYQRGKQAFQSGWNREKQTLEKLRAEYRAGYNIAVVTGPLSQREGKCLIVLDCDIRSCEEQHKREAWAKAKEIAPGIKPTTKTGGGGAHSWFWVPVDCLPNRDKVILAEGPMIDAGNGKQKPAWQIEVLLNGHACTCPPSIHPSGARYEWANGPAHTQDAPETLIASIERAADAVRGAVASTTVAARGMPQSGEKNAPAGDSAAQQWPELLPLPEGLPAVAPFDFALLPETLQPWASDICERVQCPSDFLGAAIIAALGSVIGRKVGIRPQEKTDWIEFPNQWALTVGRPGVLKSPAMEAALLPLKRLAAQAADAHGAEMEQYQQAARLVKLRAEASEKAARAKLAKNPQANVSGDLVGDEAEAPTLRRYIANDTTAAALGELLRQNPNGLLVFRDEMVSLLKGLDREDNAEARGFYLTAWNGNSAYTFDRIGRGMNLHIPAVCLSMLGSTQPGRIAEYLRAAVKGGAGDDGLIQRFGLLVWPDTDGTWRDVDRWPDSEARRKANAVFEALDRLDAEAIGATKDDFDTVPFLRFDAAGLGLFREWREGWEAKLRGGELHPALESHLAKYRKLVPGLALILHLANGGTGPVTRRTTLQALAWAEYLETHARRAYASVTSPEVTAAKAILEKLRRRELSPTFSARDIYRRGWAHLSEREHVLEALQLLADLDWLAVYTRGTEGRTATVYEVNPRGFAP